MARKKTKKATKTKKPKKSTTKSVKKKSNAKTKAKKANEKASGNDLGIVVVEDDLSINKDAELEERKAFLEEARSQEAFD